MSGGSVFVFRTVEGQREHAFMFHEDINYGVFYLGTVLKWMTLWFQVCVAGIEYVFGLYFCECCLLNPPLPPPFFLIPVGSTHHV
jgi:hypothetical protein